MKIIPLTILSITLSVSLFARLNPFEPTDHFLEQKEMIMKANEEEKIKKEQENKDKIAQQLKAQELEKQEKAMKIAQVKKDKEAERIADLKAKEEILREQKARQIAKMEQKIQTEKMAMKKDYVPEIKENFKILPFVKIFVVNDILTIKVDKKYRLLNQDILKPAKKLLFDFEGNVSFYTIRKDIISESFKSLAVGTHMKENFFRVVIDLPSDVVNYTEKIDSKNGIITITKK